MIPNKIILTKGKGIAKDRLVSFEYALRDAHIAQFNLVPVSSILPPHVQILDMREKNEYHLALEALNTQGAGSIIHCVIARSETNEPDRLINASVGIAVPKDTDHHGYLSEHHGFGMNEKDSGEYAEDLAAQLLASTLGIDLDLNKSWDEREDLYKSSGLIIETDNISSAFHGLKDGWVTVIAGAVLL